MILLILLRFILSYRIRLYHRDLYLGLLPDRDCTPTMVNYEICQKFENETIDMFSNACYILVKDTSNYCLNVSHDRGDTCTFWAKHGGDSQKWIIVHGKLNACKFKCGDRCMEYMPDDDVCRMQTCCESENQQFMMVEDEDEDHGLATQANVTVRHDLDGNFVHGIVGIHNSGWGGVGAKGGWRANDGFGGGNVNSSAFGHGGAAWGGDAWGGGHGGAAGNGWTGGYGGGNGAIASAAGGYGGANGGWDGGAGWGHGGAGWGHGGAGGAGWGGAGGAGGAGWGHGGAGGAGWGHGGAGGAGWGGAGWGGAGAGWGGSAMGHGINTVNNGAWSGAWGVNGAAAMGQGIANGGWHGSGSVWGSGCGASGGGALGVSHSRNGGVVHGVAGKSVWGGLGSQHGSGFGAQALGGHGKVCLFEKELVSELKKSNLAPTPFTGWTDHHYGNHPDHQAYYDHGYGSAPI